MSIKERHYIQVKGIVQGVGFRPFVYGIARELELTGFVLNDGQGVLIEVEGGASKLDYFRTLLVEKSPPLSYIDEIKWDKIAIKNDDCFEIKTSVAAITPQTYISPDMGICQACKEELQDKKDRRYDYPFINCTQCGPRFTIIQSLPYDRKATTMTGFKLCPTCQGEYEDPENRRFHAEPTCCKICGPQLKLVDSMGQTLAKGRELQEVRELLKSGHIIAIKGLGGYHLACQVKKETIIKLRKSKKRDQRPFAIMVKELQTVSRYCYISDLERDLLLSSKAPIVLLSKKASCIEEVIAPHTSTLGVMLPYTPLHQLFFEDGLDSLIMTSGNLPGEPIYYTDELAYDKLRGVADYFLMHNRPIYIGIDDSVTRIIHDKEYIIRRARGYVPFPVDLSFFISKREKSGGKLPEILACGGEQKNTFCLIKGNKAFISQHIGDIKSQSGFAFFKRNRHHFEDLFGVSPQIIAYDLHPTYLTTAYALSQKGVQKEGVQHHHAHIAACCAENQIVESVIGVAFDGTGYGEDGCIWGGEFFVGQYTHYKRVAHLQYIKILGGEKAIYEPWRLALSYLLHIEQDMGERLEENQKMLIELYKRKLCKNSRQEDIVDPLKFLTAQWNKHVNAPLGSSMGRLFDAVSALIGLCEEVSYEAEGAIWLESLAASYEKSPSLYPYTLREDREGLITIEIYEILLTILEEMAQGVNREHIAATFHHTIIHLTTQVCQEIRKLYGIKGIALSGGVFQNKILLEGCIEQLTAEGFKVYSHSKVPTNDGGIALGQSAIALMRWLEKGENHPCV